MSTPKPAQHMVLTTFMLPAGYHKDSWRMDGSRAEELLQQDWPGTRAFTVFSEYGELLRLNAKIGPSWGPEVTFRRMDAAEDDPAATFSAQDTTNTKGISFVARSDIEGRALMVFYPVRPLSWIFQNEWPGRAGFVR